MKVIELINKYKSSINPPYSERDIGAVFLTLFLLILIPLTVIGVGNRTVITSQADIGGYGLIGQINAYRASYGRALLAEDKNLVNSACWLTKDMATKDYHSHTDSLGRDMEHRLTAFGVGSNFWKGENLAAGTALTNAGQTLAAWKNSPGHNAVLLDPNYRRIGVGVAYNPGTVRGWFWAADFASGSPGTPVNQCGGDIQLNSLTISKSTYLPGERVPVTIQVKNIGLGHVTSAFNTYYQIGTSMRPCAVYYYSQKFSTTGLIAGTTKTFKGSFYAPANPGTYTIRAYTDLNCNILELKEGFSQSNDGNNAKNITFRVAN